MVSSTPPSFSSLHVLSHVTSSTAVGLPAVLHAWLRKWVEDYIGWMARIQPSGMLSGTYDHAWEVEVSEWMDVETRSGEECS